MKFLIDKWISLENGSCRYSDFDKTLLDIMQDGGLSVCTRNPGERQWIREIAYPIAGGRRFGHKNYEICVSKTGDITVKPSDWQARHNYFLADFLNWISIMAAHGFIDFERNGEDA